MENAAMNRFDNIQTREIDRQTINAPQYGINRRHKRQKRLQMKVRHLQRMILLAEKRTSASAVEELS
jgi:hypothetical protein